MYTKPPRQQLRYLLIEQRAAYFNLLLQFFAFSFVVGFELLQRLLLQRAQNGLLVLQSLIQLRQSR